MQKEDEELIDSTVSKILSSKIVILLEQITARLNSYTFKSKSLMKWIKSLLKYHSSVLISTPNISEIMNPLVGIIKNKTKNFNSILEL